MRRTLHVLTVAALTAFISLIAATGASALPTINSDQAWQQVFGDDFDGIALDPTKWNTCYWWMSPGGGCTNTGNGELQWYTPANVIVSNGTAKLRAQKQTAIGPDGKSYPYTSGLISTGRTSKLLATPPKFQFTYGYMEMRARVPRGNGFLSTFWTLPSSQTWPPEMDAMEVRGDKPNGNHMALHTAGPSGTVVRTDSTWSGPDFSGDFHTFGMDWEPDKIVWYVDGVVRFWTTDTSKIPTQPMYVLANLAVGGNWVGAPNEATAFPSEMEIDYIRVFQKGPKPAPAPAAATVSTASGLDSVSGAPDSVSGAANTGVVTQTQPAAKARAVAGAPTMRTAATAPRSRKATRAACRRNGFARSHKRACRALLRRR